jgi:hypothetical protein
MKTIAIQPPYSAQPATVREGILVCTTLLSRIIFDGEDSFCRP